MPKYFIYLALLILIIVPLYPKFPLIGVTGTFVAVRLEDIIIAIVVFLSLFTNIANIKNIFRQPILQFIMVYLAVGLVSTFSAVFLTKTTGLSLGFLHTFRRFEYLSLAFVGFTALTRLSQITLVTKTIILVSLLVAIYGLGQQYLGWPLVSTTNSEFAKGLALSLGPGARINSTFAGHYDLAAFSVFPLCLILAFLPLSRYKWVLLGIAGLVYWVLLMSASRITFVSFFIAAALLIVSIRKFKWLPLLVGISFIGVFVSPQLRGRYLELFTNHFQITLVSPVSAAQISRDVNDTPDALKPPAAPEDRSFNIRLKVEWPKAIRSVVKNPILGTGFSSLGLAVDNEYLRTLAETGVLGLIAFGLIFRQIFRPSPPLSPPASAFVLAVNCSIIGLLINAVFIDVFAASKIAIFTWTLVGLTQKIKYLSAT